MKFAVSVVFVFTMTAAVATPDLPDLQRMTARYAPVEMRGDIEKFSAGDREAVAKLIEAAYLIDDIFLTQYWSGNHKLYEQLKSDETPLGKARLAYFWLNKGPWSALDEHKAFLPGVPERKLPGANFYPEDMSKAEFEAWVKTLPPAEKEAATGFFTVVRRSGKKLVTTPYSEEYGPRLKRLASLLREAALLTDNASLKAFLTTRAAAFLSDDYYESDVVWMDLDAPVDVTIGPYETYNDELFGYKASFEAYVNIRDEDETKKVNFFSAHLQEIENNLPIDAKFRNPKIGAMAPIRVVNELVSTGDAAHGVRTAAYNLPNDERVVRQKGSKRVMLKNVQEAKFHSILEPIAQRVLGPEDRANLSFEWFFTHILAHELSHGIGPHTVVVDGSESSPRKELKELYSAIEEAKADITGLFMLQYMLDKKMLQNAGPDAERLLYTTFLASSFRTLRFGISEAHGRGMALQFNYLADKGAFSAHADGTFSVNLSKMKSGVRDLTHNLLTIEAKGDYAGAKAMLEKLAILRPALKSALEGLGDIPIDINPNPVTANKLVPRPAM